MACPIRGGRRRRRLRHPIRRTPTVSPPLSMPSRTVKFLRSSVANATPSEIKITKAMIGQRSETDIMNIVEQRIWHSMEEGQFENLPGKGKPLDLSTNPHADPAEDTLYRILSRNKCAGTRVGLAEQRDNEQYCRMAISPAESIDAQRGWK